MICKHCGSELQEGSLFCTVCGQKVTSSGDDYFAPGYIPPAEPAGEVPETPSFGGYEAPAYGGYEAPGYSDVDASSAAGSAESITTPEKPKGKGLKMGLLLGSIGLVLVVGVVIWCVMMMFGGPVTDITMAFEDMLDEGNFTVEMEMDGDEVTIMVDMDMDAREMTMYMETDGIVVAIYDGYAITSYRGNCQAEDISDELDDMFDRYEEYGREEIDWEELLNSIDKDAYDEACEYIDFDALDDCLASYFKTINDEDWLEEYAGFSESSKRGITYYTFEPDLYDFAVASLKEFENVVVDPDDFDDMMDELKDVKSEMREAEIEIVVGLDGSDLASISFSGEIDGDREEFSIEFSDIGDTVIDIDELEDLLDEAL